MTQIKEKTGDMQICRCSTSCRYSLKMGSTVVVVVGRVGGVVIAVLEVEVGVVVVKR